MAKIPLGFVKERTSAEQKGEEENVTLRGIDNDFDKMVSILQLEKKQLVKDLKLEKKIKKELVTIHKKIQKLEKEIKQRQTLLAQVYAIQKDNPRRALVLLEEIDRMDAHIGPQFKPISDNLEKHAVAELSLLYQGISLSREEVVAIRGIANTLSARLNQLGNQINLQETEGIRRNIYYHNQNLR
ncbi:hypothetical protein HYT55_00625 [Candidatus Woesearchaeota archaeon]|nr:hypothetical protein [Candidatus Woesearchaeota archaeon]